MKNRFLIPALSISGLVLFALTSCQQGTNSNTAKNAADSLSAKVAKSNTGVIDSSDNVILPSPLQIGSIFKHAGLTYMPGLTHSAKEISQYNSTYSEAINMGVYGADLSYCALNKQTQEALNYLKTLHSLADKIGFGTIFESNSMAKRFENNLSSEDSLTGIIADLQMDADTYLATNHQKYISSVTFAGAWVESMYIGSKVYEQKKNENLSQRISEQMTILDNLVKTLNNYKGQDSHMAELISSLKGIEDSYMGYEEVKKMNKDSDELVKLTEAHIAELSKEIQQLREKFILS